MANGIETTGTSSTIFKIYPLQSTVLKSLNNVTVAKNLSVINDFCNLQPFSVPTGFSFSSNFANTYLLYLLISSFKFLPKL